MSRGKCLRRSSSPEPDDPITWAKVLEETSRMLMYGNNPESAGDKLKRHMRVALQTIEGEKDAE